MKQSYLTAAFQKTAEERFPTQAEALKAAFDEKMRALRAENTGATKEKLRHLEGQIMPGIAAYETLQTVMLFGETAGFAATEIQTGGGVWRIDMTKCPYHDACVQHDCPELCTCFCDSDDITYDGLHPKLYWHRTKTLGRGGDCCDFCLRLR